jgi:hypothetical protein
MKTSKKKIFTVPLFLIPYILFLFCCTTPLLVPTETDLARAQNKWSNINLVSLKQGHALYVNKCGSCHYLYRPNKYSEEKWKKEMPEMSQRAKISGEEQELILRYLLSMHDAYSHTQAKN